MKTIEKGTGSECVCGAIKQVCYNARQFKIIQIKQTKK